MAWHDNVRTGIAWPVAAGLATLVLGFGGFGAWAALAPLEGAVVTQGKVIASGHNKVVQHLEGGIVKQILVREGQRVSAGDALIELDDTAAKSQENSLRLQLAMLEAMEARAIAERDKAEAVIFPDHLVGDPSAELAILLEDQEKEFGARLRRHRAELAVLERQIAALEEQIVGHERQTDETRRQIELIAEEREALEELLARKLTRKSQVLALKRSEADLRGREGQLTAAIAQARQSIAQIEHRILQAKTARIGEASSQLAETRFRRAETLEQLRAAEDVSNRRILRAPAAGIVVSLTKHNPGAVIAPGQKIMTIVPDRSDLVVEAHVRPQNIGDVRVGQSAWLRFTAFDAEQGQPVPATVNYVSADRLENERTGEGYYLARLAISADSSRSFGPAEIGPGHDTQVFIATGGRTFLEYLLKPLTQTLNRSFRES